MQFLNPASRVQSLASRSISFFPPERTSRVQTLKATKVAVDSQKLPDSVILAECGNARLVDGFSVNSGPHLQHFLEAAQATKPYV